MKMMEEVYLKTATFCGGSWALSAVNGLWFLGFVVGWVDLVVVISGSGCVFFVWGWWRHL